MSTIFPGYLLVSQSYITATGRAKRFWLCNRPLCYTMYDVTTLLRGSSSPMFLLICQLPEEHKCNEWK